LDFNCVTKEMPATTSLSVWHLLPLCLAIVVRAGKVQREGVEGKIVGGVETTPYRYPWYVSTILPGCGGQLILPDVFLSAAHCESAFYGDVYTNAFDKNNVAECSSQSNVDCTETISCSATKRHPRYNDNTLDFDYLLVKLSKPSLMSPIKLNYDSDTVKNGDGVVTAGFGTTSSGGSVSDRLLEVELDYVDSKTCDDSPYVYSNEDITRNMICAIRPSKDACQGDSGGPLFVKDKNDVPSADILVGIVSWGYGCADVNTPGVYADVNRNLDWIVTEACAMTSISGECALQLPNTNICKGEKRWEKKTRYWKGKIVKFQGKLFKSLKGGREWNKNKGKKPNLYEKFWEKIGDCGKNAEVAAENDAEDDSESTAWSFTAWFTEADLADVIAIDVVDAVEDFVSDLMENGPTYPMLLMFLVVSPFLLLAAYVSMQISALKKQNLQEKDINLEAARV